MRCLWESSCLEQWADGCRGRCWGGEPWPLVDGRFGRAGAGGGRPAWGRGTHPRVLFITSPIPSSPRGGPSREGLSAFSSSGHVKKSKKQKTEASAWCWAAGVIVRPPQAASGQAGAPRTPGRRARGGLVRLSGRQGRSQHCPPPGLPAAPVLRPSGGGGAQRGARDVASGVLGGKLSQAPGRDGACGGETRGLALGGPLPSPLPLGLWGLWRGGRPWGVWVRGLCGPRLGARACGIPEGWGVVGPRGPHGTSLLTHTEAHTQSHTQTDSQTQTHVAPRGGPPPAGGAVRGVSGALATGQVLSPPPAHTRRPGGVGDGKEVDQVSGL